MLKRVLVPFIELFVLLAMQFWALFFVSAALEGEGQARPIDELFMVSAKIHNPFLSLSDDFNDYTPAVGGYLPWPHVVDAFMAVGSLDDFKTGQRLRGWGATRDHIQPWKSVNIGGVCYAFDEAAPDYVNTPSYQSNKGIPDAESIGSLPIMYPTYLRKSFSSFESFTPFSNGGIGLSFAFRPQDIVKPLVVEITGPISTISATALEVSTGLEQYLSVGWFTKVPDEGVEAIGNRPRSIEEIEAESARIEAIRVMGEIPWVLPEVVYYVDEQCGGRGMVKLFLLFSSSGVEMSLLDPRINL